MSDEPPTSQPNDAAKLGAFFGGDVAKQTAKWELWAEWRTRVEKWGRVTVTRSVDSHDRRVIVAAEWFDERTLTSSYDVATVDNVRKAQALGLAMVRQLRDDAICARGGA